MGVFKYGKIMLTNKTVTVIFMGPTRQFNEKFQLQPIRFKLRIWEFSGIRKSVSTINFFSDNSFTIIERAGFNVENTVELVDLPKTKGFGRL